MKFIQIAVIALFCLTAVFTHGYSYKYKELNKSLRENLPKGAQWVKNNWVLSAANAGIINNKYKSQYRKGDKITIYKAVSTNNSILAYAIASTKISTAYSSFYKFSFIFDGSKTLQKIEILELSDATKYSYKITNQIFLNQFINNKEFDSLNFGKNLDAVSGATESSGIVLESLRISSAILNLYY